MRVLLPSKGILGQRVVNVYVPTFRDIYKVQDLDACDFIKKCEFLKQVSDCDLSKVTCNDINYTFTLVSFSLLNNNIKYDLTCNKCGESFTETVQLGNQDILQLKLKRTQLPYSKRINTVRYQFTIPSAQQIYNAYDSAQYEEDTERAMLDLTVAAIMCKDGDRNYALSLPVSVYASALAFQEIFYHGIDSKEECKCPKCGNAIKYKFVVSSKILDFNRDTMIMRYASVHDYMSFNDFMAMSIRDFNVFVSEMNKKNG